MGVLSACGVLLKTPSCSKNGYVALEGHPRSIPLDNRSATPRGKISTVYINHSGQSCWQLIVVAPLRFHCGVTRTLHPRVKVILSPTTDCRSSRISSSLANQSPLRRSTAIFLTPQPMIAAIVGYQRSKGD